MTDPVTIIGFAAGALTTLSFVPQVVKTFRTKSCADLSYGMLLAFAAGITLWTIYGIALREPPIIVANAVTLALIVTILLMKVRYREP